MCDLRPLQLLDVYLIHGKVALLGYADHRFVGQRVSIRFSDTGEVVATPTVRADGYFSTTARKPAKKYFEHRNWNRARYQAFRGREKSLNLKLIRRTYVTSVVQRGGKITLTGRLRPPFAKPMRPLGVQRRMRCGQPFKTIVAKVMPNADGVFQVTFDAPVDCDRRRDRTKTQVFAISSSGRPTDKLADTYSLPREALKP